MTSRILRWLNQSKSAPKKYRIIHDPVFGYAAAWRCTILDDWRAIDPYGRDAASVDRIAHPLWHDLWVKTEEEAGQRINLHATNRGQKTVWSA